MIIPSIFVKYAVYLFITTFTLQVLGEKKETVSRFGIFLI